MEKEKKFERLTKRGEDGKAYAVKIPTSSYVPEVYEESAKLEAERLERLCELEDKIENGQLVERSINVKCCVFCRNAYTDSDIPFGECDGSSMAIGDCAPGYSMFLDSSSAVLHSPVSIGVLKWVPDISRNICVAKFVPNYCPICGREIKENQSKKRTVPGNE